MSEILEMLNVNMQSVSWIMCQEKRKSNNLISKETIYSGRI